jgi:hypothetical protein
MTLMPSSNARSARTDGSVPSLATHLRVARATGILLVVQLLVAAAGSFFAWSTWWLSPSCAPGCSTAPVYWNTVVYTIVAVVLWLVAAAGAVAFKAHGARTVWFPIAGSAITAVLALAVYLWNVAAFGG